MVWTNDIKVRWWAYCVTWWIILHLQTLVEVWSSNVINSSTLKVYQFLAYNHVGEVNLEPRSKKGGHESGVKGFNVWWSFDYGWFWVDTLDLMKSLRCIQSLRKPK